MATFGQKPSVNPFGKMSISRLFELSVFIGQKGVFSFQNIVKKHFPRIYRLKRKFGKNAIFGAKPWVNPFGKMSIFRLFELFVFIAQKGVFFVLKYRTRLCRGLYCPKRKVGKVAIFGPKPWLNRFGRMSIFRLFEIFVFIAQIGVLSFQDIVKDIFLAYIA